MSDLTKEINNALIKRISKEIDFDAMAKRLKPVIEKQMEEGLLRAIKNTDWDEALWNLLGDGYYGKQFDAKIAQVMGMSPKPPKPKKGNKK